MTANYFMLTLDGGHGLDWLPEFTYPPQYRPFFRGAGPTVTSNTDNRAQSVAFRENLVSNPSFEVDTTGWVSTSATLARTTAQHDAGAACLAVTATATFSVIAKTPEGTSGIPVTPGVSYSLSFRSKAATVGRTVFAYIVWFNSSGNAFGLHPALASATNNTGAWTTVSVAGAAPAGAAYASVYMNPSGLGVGEVHYFDAVLFEAASAGAYFDGSTAYSDDGTTTRERGWRGTAHASPSYEAVTPYDQPSPAPLDATDNSLYCYGPSKTLLLTKDDNLAAITKGGGPVPVSGYNGANFRAVRTVGVADDSANALATQIYDHGWLLAERPLMWGRGEDDDLYWDQNNGEVVPITGTPEVNDGRGVYGFDTVTWPGSGVGVGTVRQIVAGAEGSTRKVAAILDLLNNVAPTQRATIASTYRGAQVSFDAATLNLTTAVLALTALEQRKFWARAGLAMQMALAIVGQLRGDNPTNTDLVLGVTWGMAAITAQEAGVVGLSASNPNELQGAGPSRTFTSGNYTTLTDPLDAVLAMPAGY